jgi:hypothetical protein
MADYGRLQGEIYFSQRTTRWMAGAFEDLAPRVRNIGGLVFGGKMQWIQPTSDDPFQHLRQVPDFAINAFFPINRTREARNNAIGYALKIVVWDEGSHRKVVISSQASRQIERPQASAARRKLIRMLKQADSTFTAATETEVTV